MIDKTKGYSKRNTMREILRDNSLLVMTVSRFGIAFGFGDETVESVCLKNNVDAATFLQVCNLLSGYPFSSEVIHLPTLIEYLKRAHSSFLEITLPRIRHHLIEAITPRDSEPGVGMLLMKFYDNYVSEVEKHMRHENKTVFPYVEELIICPRTDSKFNISRYSDTHSHAAAKLNELKDIFIYHYSQKENPRLSSTLFDIVMCEKDLMSHFQVETQLFVPTVEELEKRIKEESEIFDKSSSKELTTTNEAELSSREKDIIKCVAMGKSNKEIASELFISPHTVATHRRNINAKLGIHSAAGLTIFAIINGLIDAAEIKLS